MPKRLTAADLLRISAVRRACADGTARTIRMQAGVSAAELAAELKVSGSALSLWERGLRAPSTVKALGYAAALDSLRRAAPSPRVVAPSTRELSAPPLRLDGTVGVKRPLRLRVPFVQSEYGYVVHVAVSGTVLFYDSGGDPRLNVKTACRESIAVPVLYRLLPERSTFCGRCEPYRRAQLETWLRHHADLLLSAASYPERVADQGSTADDDHEGHR